MTDFLQYSQMLELAAPSYDGGLNVSRGRNACIGMSFGIDIRHHGRLMAGHLLSSFMAAACSCTSSMTSLTCSSCMSGCNM